MTDATALIEAESAKGLGKIAVASGDPTEVMAAILQRFEGAESIDDVLNEPGLASVEDWLETPLVILRWKEVPSTFVDENDPDASDVYYVMDAVTYAGEAITVGCGGMKIKAQLDRIQALYEQNKASLPFKAQFRRADTARGFKVYSLVAPK